MGLPFKATRVLRWRMRRICTWILAVAVATPLLAQSNASYTTARLWKTTGTRLEQYSQNLNGSTYATVDHSGALSFAVADSHYSAPWAGSTVFVPGSVDRIDPCERGEGLANTQVVDYVRVMSNVLPAGTPVQIVISWRPSIYLLLGIYRPADASASGRITVNGGPTTTFSFIYSSNPQFAQNEPIILNTNVGATFSIFSQLYTAAYAGIYAPGPDPVDSIASIRCEGKIVMRPNKKVTLMGISKTIYWK